MKSIITKASQLLADNQQTDLEQLLITNIKKSYDIEFWRIYVQYVRKYKPERILDAYEYTLNRFEHHWDALPLYQAYINALLGRDDTARARTAFQKGLAVPMAGLTQLWKEYESFELGINKAQGKKHITDHEVVYQEALKNYNRLKQTISPNANTLELTLENFYFLTDLECAHVRKEFIFLYLLGLFPESEEVYFAYCEYLIGIGMIEKAREVIKDAISKLKSSFLIFYFSTFCLENIDKLFEDLMNSSGGDCLLDTKIINYLNYKLKTAGVEEFRKLFLSLQDKMGPHVFVYVANLEYRITGDVRIVFNMFTRGLNFHPENNFLHTEFFLFFLRIGDKINAHAIFNRIEKTEGVWKEMVDYEYKYGDNSGFRKLIEKYEWVPVERQCKPINDIFIDSPIYKRYKMFLKSFEFMDLQINKNFFIEDFISALPESTCLYFDYERVIGVIKEIELE